MIAVHDLLLVGGHELVPWHASHRFEHAFVAHSASPNLALDHLAGFLVSVLRCGATELLAAPTRRKRGQEQPAGGEGGGAATRKRRLLARGRGHAPDLITIRAECKPGCGQPLRI